MEKTKEKEAPVAEKIDRKLGDEWDDWDGSSAEDTIEEEKSTFLFFAVAGGVVIVLLTLFIWYMITPRLEQFNSYLPAIMGVGVVVGLSIFALFLFSVIITALTEKGYLGSCVQKNFLFSFLVPLAIRLGNRFGISRDRMGNSFIKVNNILVKSSSRSLQPHEVLVLLPRCIEKETRKEILRTIEICHCKSYTATGGSSARKMISELRPKAIIAVACERDLLTGLQDVAPKIPVIAIPNKRPEGPCKNTVIDLEFFKQSLDELIREKLKG